MAARKLLVQGQEWQWAPGRRGFQLRPPEGSNFKSMYFDMPEPGMGITPGLVKYAVDQLLTGKTQQDVRSAFHGHVAEHRKERAMCSKSPDDVYKEHCSDWPEFECCFCGRDGHV